MNSTEYMYDGSVEQQKNYFPYGGLLNDVTNSMDVQTRKYNGKELDRMHGLDLYDYSARQYDAALGCFTSMDPLCEKYYHISPYAYCAGNPVKYVDPDGVSTFHTHPSGWTTSYETRDNTNASQSFGIGAESVERYFEQTPSTIDNQRFLKNTLVHYVFGRRSGKTYICQIKNNISVQVATILTSKFFKLR